MENLAICPLISGSKGNSHLITNGKTNILVDCGISAKLLSEKLSLYGKSPADLDGFLISHEHTDHTKGAGIICRKFGVPIYATRGTWQAMYKNIKPVGDEFIHIIAPEQDFLLGDILISPFTISHDAKDPVGYTFSFEKKKISVATDTGIADDRLISALSGSDVALIEANHDKNMLIMGSYTQSLKHRIISDRGHLSNDAAGTLSLKLIKSGTKTILIGHLSEENNYPELAYLTVKNIIEEGGFKEGKDVTLSVVTKTSSTQTYLA